jgi:hypothetical protein
MGAKHMIEYNSPHIKPNPTFNYWQDIKTNVMQRNKWDDASLSARSAQDADDGERGSIGMLANFHNRQNSGTASGKKVVSQSRT